MTSSVAGNYSYGYLGQQSGIATGFEALATDLHASNSKLSALVTYSVLSMGLANLFWMPLALCFGKRPVVLVSMTMFLGGIIWSSVAKDYNSLLGSRVFASFGEFVRYCPNIRDQYLITLIG